MAIMPASKTNQVIRCLAKCLMPNLPIVQLIYWQRVSFSVEKDAQPLIKEESKFMLSCSFTMISKY